MVSPMLTIAIVMAAIRTQVTSGAQSSTSCSCGRPSGLYNLLTSSYFSKYPSPLGKDDPIAGECSAPLPCVYNQPSRLPRMPALPGTVLYTPGVLQRTLPAPPSSVYVPSPTPAVESESSPNSYIMTIPRKYSSDSSSTYYSNYNFPTSTTFSSIPSDSSSFERKPEASFQPATSNSIYPPATQATINPPRPIYYTQQASLIASCPATVFFPAAPAVSYIHPPRMVYSINQNLPLQEHHAFLSNPITSPSPNSLTSLDNNSAHTTVTSSSSTTASTGSAAKDCPLTYTLLNTSVSNEVSSPSNLEADNRDCSVPIPPSLV